MPKPRFPAKKHPDGTYSIFGVPVFGELEKGARGNPVAFRRRWMLDAIKRFKQRDAEGYKYRLHVFHHGDSEKPQAAGTFKLTAIRKLNIGGEPMDVLHADFHGLNEDTFRRIQSGELLYRSVEILNVKGAPEIDSIALLSTETPFFRLPVTDGDTVTLEDDLAVPVGAAGPVSFHSSGDAGVAVFKDQVSRGTPMPKMTLLIEDGALLGKLESGEVFKLAEGDEPRDGEFIVKTTTAEYAATFADDEPKNPKDETKKDEEIKRLKAELAKLRKRLQDGEKKDDEDEDDDDDKDGKMAADASTIARLQARIDVLEEQSEEREKADRTAKRADEAIAQLRAEGWHVPGRCVENIKLYAAANDDALLDNYVEEFRATRPKDPRKFTGDTGGDTMPDEVRKFVADGPDALEKAEKFSAEYDQLAHLGAIRMTREEFIEARMKPLIPAGD